MIGPRIAIDAVHLAGAAEAKSARAGERWQGPTLQQVTTSYLVLSNVVKGWLGWQGHPWLATVSVEVAPCGYDGQKVN